MAFATEKLFSMKRRNTQIIEVSELGRLVIQAPSEVNRAEIETTLGKDSTKRLVIVHCVIKPESVDLVNPATGKEREVGEVWRTDPGVPAYMKKQIDGMGQLDSTVINDIADQCLDLMRMPAEDRVLLGEPAKP